MMAASTIEPPVGASTCASGSQVCTGHIGTLTAKAARNARNSRICGVMPIFAWCQSKMPNWPPETVYR
jgi:hypothetical protein